MGIFNKKEPLPAGPARGRRAPPRCGLHPGTVYVRWRLRPTPSRTVYIAEPKVFAGPRMGRRCYQYMLMIRRNSDDIFFQVAAYGASSRWRTIQ